MAYFIKFQQKTPIYLRRDITPPAPGTIFVLDQPFEVWVEDADGKGWTFIVPAGFETDLASVPRAFRWVASTTDGIEASILHDYVYETRCLSRDLADQLFDLMLRADSILPSWRRWLMFKAVRLFGGSVYRS